MEHLENFIGDDAGAVTVDWIVLTSGILLVGIVTIYAIYWTGVSSLVTEVGLRSVSFLSDLEPGEAPEVNP